MKSTTPLRSYSVVSFGLSGSIDQLLLPEFAAYWIHQDRPAVVGVKWSFIDFKYILHGTYKSGAFPSRNTPFFYARFKFVFLTHYEWCSWKSIHILFIIRSGWCFTSSDSGLPWGEQTIATRCAWPSPSSLGFDPWWLRLP